MHFFSAVFGVIWTHFHAQSVCLTIADFQEGVREAFKNSKLKVGFHDLVYQVPDYESFISPCIDPELGGGFKMEKTMHQCRRIFIYGTFKFKKYIIANY